MTKEKVFIVEQMEPMLSQAVEACGADRLFILTDETTRRLCLPLVERLPCLQGAATISIGAGDCHKTLDSVAHVWAELQRRGATRHSLLINLGGGMVTDLGGFAASTFKRGISFINIPTTLLAMVDASVGGKTGVNFGGLKNEVGVFSDACCVLLHTGFLATLDAQNILSGYAEMLKHGLISTEEHWAELLRFDPVATAPGTDEEQPRLDAMLARSVAVKERIVEEDPTEKGIRKALNLGHTVGHAFEALALRRNPVLHGYAVAWGLVCELYLSVAKAGFSVEKMRQTVRYINDHYGRMAITCDDYPTLIELMTHDKKNTAGSINFTLLADIGDIRINQTATRQEIEEALDFYREG